MKQSLHLLVKFDNSDKHPSKTGDTSSIAHNSRMNKGINGSEFFELWMTTHYELSLMSLSSTSVYIRLI